MAVRKIPVRRHPYIKKGGTLSAVDSNEELEEDTTVTEFITKIRQAVLTDRALYDKVNICPSLIYQH